MVLDMYLSYICICYILHIGAVMVPFFKGPITSYSVWGP